MNTATGPYMAQEEPQMWHHHGASGHAMFHNEFADFVHTGIPSIQQPIPETENHLPSPPITVSGSDMSSPGGQNGNITPPQQLIQCNIRPPPARSPYEWIKKTSYQTQPTPGKTRTKDKYRVVYTDHQRLELEKEFTFVNKYITIRRKSELAATLGLSERQVKIWFQNRRAKERKQTKKRIEEKTHLDIYNNLAPTLQPQDPIDHNSVISNIPQSSHMMQRFLHEEEMKSESN